MVNNNHSQQAPIATTRGAIIGSSHNLRRIGEAGELLFDLDDTIAVYDPQFLKRCLYRSIRDHAHGMSNKDSRRAAAKLHGSMYDGSQQKTLLSAIIAPTDISSFWQGFNQNLYQGVNADNVRFDSRLIKFINFAARNAIDVGVISNSTEEAGHRVLSIMNGVTGIDLHDRSTFLGAGPYRKPKEAALGVYRSETGDRVVSSRGGVSAYIGNAVSDLVFAQNTDMVPVLIDYDNNTSDKIKRHSAAGEALIDQSVVINDFAAIKNHVELQRPHYRRQISFLVDRALSNGEQPIDRQSITLEPSEDAVYHIAHDAAAEVMSYVPAIWQGFHDSFSGRAGRFSFADLPNYQYLTSEASGAYLLPRLDAISDKAVQEYYSDNRVRREGMHTTNRGPVYYRQYIDSVKGDFGAQLGLVEAETSAALDVLRNPALLNDNDHIAVLGVEDNLRGNLLSTYLSLMNVFRDTVHSNDAVELAELADSLYEIYNQAVSLQYGHMLGLDYDREGLVNKIEDGIRVLRQYKDICTKENLSPKFKNPEIDNPLMIAVRANYLCQQYPDTDILVGLTSGGVELAAVSKLFYEQNYRKSVDILSYPISVHNGQTMWSSDKAAHTSQDEIDKSMGIERVRGQRVVVCEDNSNSGQTLDRVVNRIKSYGASDVHFAVVEIDPTRVILHHVQQKAGAKHNIGQAASRVRPIANYYHPDFRGAVSVVKILPQDNSFSKIIAMDTANRYLVE